MRSRCHGNIWGLPNREVESTGATQSTCTPALTGACGAVVAYV